MWSEMSTTELPGETKVAGEIFHRSDEERTQLDELRELSTSVLGKLGDGWNAHLMVSLTRQSVSRILYFDHLYRQLIGTPGVICEFGVQWGAGMSLLMNLRGIYEPYNHSRRIVGFDTFTGFPDVDPLDGPSAAPGDYAVAEGYEELLAKILAIQEGMSPIPHMRKFELVKGDVNQTIESWLERNPQAIIGMAIFDMDLYGPTKHALEKILPRLTKGSILVFDEVNCPPFPGETTALREVIGLGNLRLRHFPHQPNCAYAIVE